MHAGGVAESSGPWNDEKDPFEVNGKCNLKSKKIIHLGIINLCLYHRVNFYFLKLQVTCYVLQVTHRNPRLTITSL